MLNRLPYLKFIKRELSFSLYLIFIKHLPRSYHKEKVHHFLSNVHNLLKHTPLSVILSALRLQQSLPPHYINLD